MPNISPNISMHRFSLFRFAKSALFVALLFLSLSASALELGSRAPNFSLSQSSEEPPMNLDHLRGNVILVVFWASWDRLSVTMLPKLNDLYKDLSEYGFYVVGVNLDLKTEYAQNWLKQKPMDYPIVFDPMGQIPDEYQVFSVPMLYLIDQHGIVRGEEKALTEHKLNVLKGEIIRLLAH